MFNEICTYNRKEKAYILTLPSGAQHTFPSGPKGKMEAYRFWLSIEYPDYYVIATQLAEANPHAERTVWKAIEIAVTPDMVDPINQDELIAMVQSISDPYGRYLISADTPDIKQQNEYLLCNCPAFQEMQPVYIFINDHNSMIQVCKHSLAVWMQRYIVQQQKEAQQCPAEPEPVPA